MVSRNYRNSSAFQSLINRMMRDYGINPDQAAMFLNTVMNVSDEETADTFRMSEADFSRLRRGSARYGRGLDEDFLRRLRGARNLSDLGEEDQVLVNLLNASTNPLFPSLLRRGTDAVVGGEKDAIQRAAMNYVTTFYLGGGNPRGGVRRVEDAIQAGNSAYGTDASLYYRDQLLPRFERITNDLISGSPELASLRNGPSISPVRKQMVRDHYYGDLTPIAQDFDPNEFVEYNVNDNTHYIRVTSRPGTSGISYNYAIPDYDIQYNNEYGNADRMFKPIENVRLYDRTEPFSKESALLNDTLEFVPEKIQELQQQGRIIPYSNARLNRENLNIAFNQIGQGWISPERSENFLNEYGVNRGRIARLRLQGLNEGWLRRTQSLGPNWQGYRSYNEEDDLALEEELQDAWNFSDRYDSIPGSESLRDPNSAFKFVDPYERHDDMVYEHAPDYGPQRGRDIPEDMWEDMTGGYIPGPNDWIPYIYGGEIRYFYKKGAHGPIPMSRRSKTN